MSSLCQVCGRAATTQCGQCETTLYCGQACADTDWTQGGHGHLCCDVTEALPLARRLFMESAMPTISAEHRAEADELVESLLLEHCAEQYFIQNPHLIDAYLEPEAPLIGAYAGDGAAAAAEEDRLIDELAEIRGEALALLEEVHLRDTSEYPGVYGLDAIGQEFGQRSEVWQRDYALLENRFTDAISAAARKVRDAASAAGRAIVKGAKAAGQGIAKGARAAGRAAKSAGRKIASGARKAVAKGKELAGHAKAAISRGAKSAAQKLRAAKNKASAKAKTFRTNVSAKFKRASERRSRNRKSNRSRSSSSSGGGGGDSYSSDSGGGGSDSPRSSDASSDDESPRPSQSDQKRAERRAEKQRAAEEKARRKEEAKAQREADKQRAADEEAAAQRQLEQDKQRREQERVVETRGRSRTRDDEAYYRSTSAEKRQKSEELRLKREVKDADRRAADANAARLEAERDAAAALQQAKQAQGTVYQPPATATTPTVVVVPAPAPAPVSPSSVSPSHTVQQGQLRTEEDRLNARIVNRLKQLDEYKAQIEKLEKDTVMDEKEKERQLDELNGYLAAAKVSYDRARQKLGQIRPQTSMSTTIFWK